MKITNKNVQINANLMIQQNMYGFHQNQKIDITKYAHMVNNTVNNQILKILLEHLQVRINVLTPVKITNNLMFGTIHLLYKIMYVLINNNVAKL